MWANTLTLPAHILYESWRLEGHLPHALAAKTNAGHRDRKGWGKGEGADIRRGKSRRVHNSFTSLLTCFKSNVTSRSPHIQLNIVQRVKNTKIRNKSLNSK